MQIICHLYQNKQNQKNEEVYFRQNIINSKLNYYIKYIYFLY